MANMTLLSHAFTQLSTHKDPNIREPVLRAWFMIDAGQITEACILLQQIGDIINPYKRAKTPKYRQLCLDASYKNSYRSIVAQLFYEMSELFYNRTHTPYLHRLAGKQILLELT